MKTGFNNFFPSTIYKDNIDNIIITEMFSKIVQGDFDEFQMRGDRNEYGKTVNIFGKGIQLINQIEELLIPFINNFIDRKISLDGLEYNLTGWIQKYGYGENIENHNHPNSHISGCLYFNDCFDNNGTMIFSDPRSNITMNQFDYFFDQREEVRFEPNKGDIIIFPSWMYHETTPNLSSNLKCVLAFNVKIIEYSKNDRIIQKDFKWN